jgi:hypothetical protein
MTAICIGTGSATVNADFNGTRLQKNMDIFATNRRGSSDYPRIISNYFIDKAPDNRFRGVPHEVGETVYITVEGTAPFRINISLLQASCCRHILNKHVNPFGFRVIL